MEAYRESKVILVKIAVITRHAIVNYGSLLQAFATQKIIFVMMSRIGNLRKHY